MARPVACLIYGERAADEWFSLGMTVGVVQQTGNVVECGRYVRVVRPVTSFGNSKCATYKRLRFGKTGGAIKQKLQDC